MRRKVPELAITTARKIVRVARNECRPQRMDVAVLTLLAITVTALGCSYGTCYQCRCRCGTASRLANDSTRTVLPMPSAVATNPALDAAPNERSAKTKGRTQGNGNANGGPFDHGKNYEWLIGRLQRVHIPRDGWKVRYAPIDEKEKWGGSMVLAPDIRLEEFSDGDSVYIEGEILTKRASVYLNGPRYRISKIQRHSNKPLRHVARDDR